MSGDGFGPECCLHRHCGTGKWRALAAIYTRRCDDDHVTRHARNHGDGSRCGDATERQQFLQFVIVVELFEFQFFLFKLIQRASLYPFVWYRLVAGCGMIVFLLLGG